MRGGGLVDAVKPWSRDVPARHPARRSGAAVPPHRARAGCAGLSVRRTASVAALVAALSATGGCDPGYAYGVGGGLAGPPHQVGGSAAVAVRRDFAPPPSSMASYFAVEGSAVAFMSHDSRGLVPLLLGSGGGRFGSFQLYVAGGFQLPGYLERYDHRVLSMFGLAGGAGIGLPAGPRLELHLTVRALWSSPTTQIDLQTGARKAEFLYWLVGLTFFFRPHPAPPPPLEPTLPPTSDGR
jgi:hypothetical protein